MDWGEETPRERQTRMLKEQLAAEQTQTKSLKDEKERLRKENALLSVRPRIHALCVQQSSNACIIGNGFESARTTWCYEEVNKFLSQVVAEIASFKGEP